MKRKQRGLGMMEVVIGLIMLSLGVIGVSTVQLRAMQSSTESLRKIQAMNLAKSYVDRVLMNQHLNASYNSATTHNGYSTSIQCFTAACTPANKYVHDLNVLVSYATAQGFRISNTQCPANTSRRCIYVVWGATNPQNGNNPADCTKLLNGRMVVNEGARCVVLEGYI